MRGHLWVVVLAGGQGTRVSAFTCGSAGERVPKQYCALGGDEPPIRWALRRAAGLVPRSRIVVVVASEHRAHWREALADVPAENIVEQPLNRGTAPGLLLPTLEILLRRDRGARLLVLPSDHHVRSEDVLQRALRAAVKAVRRPDAPVVLLGMVGEYGDHEYGWIVPTAGKAGGLRRVLSFVEKPDPQRSRELLGIGALVNSFIFACPGSALVQLYESALPALLRAFVPAVLAGRPPAMLRDLYEAIPSHDFSRTVLEGAAGALAVLGVPPCGWSDLGTPARLARFLERPRSGRPLPVVAVSGARC